MTGLLRSVLEFKLRVKLGEKQLTEGDVLPENIVNG